MNFTIEIEKEEDGRWITEILEIPGVMTYGNSREEAIKKVKALAFHIIAERIENGENIPEIDIFFSIAA